MGIVLIVCNKNLMGKWYPKSFAGILAIYIQSLLFIRSGYRCHAMIIHPISCHDNTFIIDVMHCMSIVIIANDVMS